MQDIWLENTQQKKSGHMTFITIMKVRERLNKEQLTLVPTDLDSQDHQVACLLHYASSCIEDLWSRCTFIDSIVGNL